MIPFVKSLTELMAITNAIDQFNKVNQSDESNYSCQDSGQRKRYIRSKDNKKVSLPNFPIKSRSNWKKSKEVVRKILNSLDYNNQIQSSYELTLMARQNNINQKDAA